MSRKRLGSVWEVSRKCRLLEGSLGERGVVERRRPLADAVGRVGEDGVKEGTRPAADVSRTYQNMSATCHGRVKEGARPPSAPDGQCLGGVWEVSRRCLRKCLGGV